MAEPDNPFPYGSIVRSGDFCPRPRLENRLASLNRSGQNAALLGPRRVGKSSLIHRSAAKVRGSTLVYADLWGARTLSDFVRRCVQALDALGDTANLLQKISRSLPGLTVTVGVDPVTGTPTLTPALSGSKKKSAPETIAQIARLWASLHEGKGRGKRRIIVALDEFQDLLEIDGADQVLGILRREIQTLGDIPFVFSGSIRNDMWKIFADDSGPFYKSAAMLEVAADDFDDWRGFLRGKFASGKLKIDDETLDRIIDLADGTPGDTQQLCAAVWDTARTQRSKKIDADTVQRALLHVFADERKGYEQIVADVTGQQLAVLRAIAHLGGGSVQSGEFLEAAGITHASSSKASATRLVQRRILQESPDGLRFSNPFFRAWLLHTRY